MDRCDICNLEYIAIELKKIVVDWDGRYKRVCKLCIEERGEYNISCGIDRPNGLNIER